MKKRKKVRALFTGGGSGGHVYPLLAVSEELIRISLEQKIDLELDYVGPRDEFAGILSSSGFHIQTIPTSKFRRYFSLANLIDIPKLFVSIAAALFKVFFIMPDVIFSKGGTGALPVVIAGWFYRVPIIIHESDAAPGLTNLLSAPFASRIAVSFGRATKYFNPKKVAWIGTPLRKDLLADLMDKETTEGYIGFDPATPLILVLGGSQGSVRINELVLANLGELLKEAQVFHQTGRANYPDVEKLSRAALTEVPLSTEVKSRYKPVPYFNTSSLKEALVAADLVVARAGSGTISEISAFGKPAVLIPLAESANDHQKINAYEFAKEGSAIVIEEPNLLSGLFVRQVISIIKNPEALKKMSLASTRFFKPGATEIIAGEILRIAG